MRAHQLKLEDDDPKADTNCGSGVQDRSSARILRPCNVNCLLRHNVVALIMHKADEAEQLT